MGLSAGKGVRCHTLKLNYTLWCYIEVGGGGVRARVMKDIAAISSNGNGKFLEAIPFKE